MHDTLLKRFLNSGSDNLKSVVSEVEGSKTCPELSRRIENPKWAGIFAIALTFAMCGVLAQAQQSKKVPRIGYLSASDPATESTRSEALCASTVASGTSKAEEATGHGSLSRGSSALAQYILRGPGTVHHDCSLEASEPIPMRKPPTGEPCAGEPHARFGGRGRRKPFPTPINSRKHHRNTLPTSRRLRLR